MTQNPAPTCRACRAQLVEDRTVRIRGAAVQLHHCPACGLFEFADPDWLDAAYADPIADIDVGLASRCIMLARHAEAIIRAERLGDRRHLDYGGGYGLLTRLLRDRGIDMRHYDPYAPNLFAQGRDGLPTASYGCVTMIEVLEHLLDPLETIRSLSTRADLIVVSTVLVPAGRTDISDWWYLIPDLGQHVTFYTVSALQAIATECGYRLTTDGMGLHVFSTSRLRPLARIAVRHHRAADLIAWFLHRRDRPASLIESDGVAAFARLSKHTARDADDGG
jgi:hypothetical protein